MTLHLLDDKTAPKSQRFRWQLKSKNGKIVAASSEGFSSEYKCAENASKTVDGIILNAPLEVTQETEVARFVKFKGRNPIEVRR